MSERLGQQSVSQPGILGQQRAMEIAADGAHVNGTLAAVFAVVAGADHRAAEGLQARCEVGAAGVVLETDQAAEGCTSYCRALLWIVPAKVDGTWDSPAGELTFEQKYQTVTGTVKSGTVIAPITDGKLKGDQITFTAGGTHYSGTVRDKMIEGTSGAGDKQTAWRAQAKK